MDRTDWIALTLAAAAVLSQVLLPPPVGLADNGDFPKIIGRFSLRSATPGTEFRYFSVHYVFKPDAYWNPGFLSSQLIPASLAVLVAKNLPGDRSFDIRLLGLIQSAMFLAAFALALPLFHRLSLRVRWALIAAAILMFCDTMYVEYYNSFFMDTAAFLFLFGAAVSFLRGRLLPASKFPAGAMFLICACLFLLSKAQHALLSLALIPFAWRQCVLLWPSRRALSRSVATAALAASAIVAFFHTPPGYATPPLFTIIFSSILPSSADPGLDLRELGLDDSFLRYRGITAYAHGSPMADWNWADRFAGRTSYGRLCAFYLRHPIRAARILGDGLDQGSYQRPPNIGNFEKITGMPHSSHSHRFALWSDFKQIVFSNRGWMYLIYFLCALASLARSRPIEALGLGCMAALALGIGAMADSAETTRHLFIFNFLADLTVFAALSTWLSRKGAAASQQ